MTEGGIAQWKKKEGEAFSAGDVLLEIVRPLQLTIPLIVSWDPSGLSRRSNSTGTMRWNLPKHTLEAIAELSPVSPCLARPPIESWFAVPTLLYLI